MSKDHNISLTGSRDKRHTEVYITCLTTATSQQQWRVIARFAVNLLWSIVQDKCISSLFLWMHEVDIHVRLSVVCSVIIQSSFSHHSVPLPTFPEARQPKGRATLKLRASERSEVERLRCYNELSGSKT